MTGLLQVTDLAVRFGEVEALRGVSFRLEAGESLVVVGESGSGKSTLALCLAGLVQPPQARGSVRLGGQELLGASPDQLRSLRWRSVAIGLQGAPFNPVATIGSQIAEPMREHLGMSREQSRRRSLELAAEVLLDPVILERLPHQLSGGERRRATLAMVLALDPALVVLDEPTAGLDPVTKWELIQRMGELARARRFGLVAITHDLSDASRLGSQAVVLYAGEAMETGATAEVVAGPVHPYTWALINAYPVMSTTRDLRPIRGQPPDPRAVPRGCPFNPRCTQAEAICAAEHPDLRPAAGRRVACHFGGLRTLLQAEGVSKSFGSDGTRLTALQDVSLTLREGESLGVIGPSGSGKSTLARILTGHLVPDAGRVILRGQPLRPSWRHSDRQVRRAIQLVMQDPWDALSPRLTVEELVREPLDLGGREGREGAADAVARALEGVGLPSSAGFLGARTHQLSGGQLQRVALARALVMQPKILVADEPTSMLDASEQARLLVILRERQVEMGLGLVLVSHDVAAVRKVTDRIVVIAGGRLVEEGPSHRLTTAPTTAITRRILATAAGFAAPSDVVVDGAPSEAAPVVVDQRRS